MQTNSLFIAFLTILFFTSCKGTKDYADYSQKVASEKLGADCECTPSGDNTYTLCLKSQRDEAESGIGVAFFVIENKSKNIIIEDSIDKGVVLWHDDSKLSMFYTPGIMREDQTRDDFTYVYDLVTKEKVLKSKISSK